MLVLQFQLVNDRLESIFKEVIIAQWRHCCYIYGRSEKQNGNTIMPADFPVTFKCALSEYKSRTPKLYHPAQGTSGITLPLICWCVYVLCKFPIEFFFFKISYCTHTCYKSGLSCSCSMDVTNSFSIAHFNTSPPLVSQSTMNASVFTYFCLIMTLKGRNLLHVIKVNIVFVTNNNCLD